MLKLTTIFMTLILLSCGKTSSKKVVPAQLQEEDFSGVFAATLNGMNTHAHRAASIIKINQEGDDFRVKLRTVGAGDGIHMQFLLAGDRCPSLRDDINKDNWLDVTELTTSSGKILIPLDDDLSQQNPGKDLFPLNDYLYEQKTSYSLLLSDLHQEDPIINDAFLKIPVGRSLNLEGKAVVVFGVNSRFELPSSVKSFGLWSPQESLPVACGILQRISREIESDFDTNFTPVPVRRVDPPQPPVVVETPPQNEGRIGWRQRVRRWYCRLRRLNCTTSLSKEARYGYIEYSSTSEDL